MTTGKFLGITLVGFLGIWLIADIGVYLLGFQTFSQWMIELAYQNKTLAWSFLGVIVFGAGWLIVHFELPQAVTKKIKAMMEVR